MERMRIRVSSVFRAIMLFYFYITKTIFLEYITTLLKNHFEMAGSYWIISSSFYLRLKDLFLKLQRKTSRFS